MIYRLRGSLIEKQPNFAIIDVNGVSYEVAISLNSYSELPAIGDEATIFTYMAVRDDGISLFGFSDIAEKQLFLLLIKVSGIGPTLAIKILGSTGLSSLQNAISSSDEALLSTIPGIGKKTAGRLIVELKDKFDTISSATSPITTIKQDVISALINLGYKDNDIRKAIDKTTLEENAPFEEVLKATLKILGGSK